MAIQLYEVGGSLRDEVLGVTPHDRDYVAVCEDGWQELLSWSEATMDKVFLVTPEFFTIRGLVDGDVMDVVMARKEGAYTDGRHPDAVEPGTLDDDLNRRDFTMNAMARPAFELEADVIDPHEGREHLLQRTIACVGVAEQRIREDALRILRAMRFHITLGMSLEGPLSKMFETDFTPMHADEEGWIRYRVSALLENVSRERVREELVKMFKADYTKAVKLLFNPNWVHMDLRRAIFGDDIWLKPTVETR